MGIFAAAGKAWACATFMKGKTGLEPQDAGCTKESRHHCARAAGCHRTTEHFLRTLAGKLLLGKELLVVAKIASAGPPMQVKQLRKTETGA